MSNEILDDLSSNNKDATKRQRTIGFSFLATGSFIGLICTLIMNHYSPSEFEEAYYLPNGFAEVIVFGSIGIAVLCGIIGLLILIAPFNKIAHYAVQRFTRRQPN